MDEFFVVLAACFGSLILGGVLMFSSMKQECQQGKLVAYDNQIYQCVKIAPK